MYSDSVITYNIEIGRTLLDSNAKIVYVPLQKTVKQKPRSKKNMAMKSVQKKKPTKKVAPKPKKPKTVLKKEAPKPKKVTPKKQQPTPKPKEQPKKKLVAKKTEPVKKPTQPKKPKPKSKPVKKKPVPKKEQPKKIAEKQLEQNIETDQEITLYVGREDLRALKIHDHVQQEIAHHWKPPRGLSKELSCCVNVLIDWSGKPKRVETKKSSGVVMYDIAARSAVFDITLPKWAHGKEFLITFKQ